MKITLVIASMDCGGAQRVMSIIVNYWARKGWKVTLLTIDDGSEPPFYDLEKSVLHIPLEIAGASGNLLAGLWNNLKRIYVMRQAIFYSNPDVVLSFIDETNVITLLATQGLNLPVVVSVHTDPTACPISKIWEQLRQWTYPRADKIVVLSQAAQNFFSPQLQNRISIIPNPVLRPKFEKNPFGQQLVKPAVIALGRFAEEKRFDLLLQAFDKLKDRHPQWTLTILGEGELRPELESLRQELGLGDRVYLPGVVKNPYEFLQQADLFVMSSSFEGFPMALCEAMACGLPVISTDCPSGPREIIRDGVDGILVSKVDAEALAAAMDKLMSDEEERQRLAARAPEVTQRFSLETVMGMWEAVISEVIGET
ncbi:glycosyltransferase family 4 protein [Funiculus sociatus GB2-A5]|uniref:Glycosyltransferase family 4 protein n=1 Tax=Funiculus sociatus GB2-A5 TaxID=2933946 RepID=A0ABV0JQH7_9CYAN|nr:MULTISPECIES: glycosyltransferase family 4 protein [unclassified Trichocoleus]MBD1906686.1 glycosyltransferase family 4 protein [Trichocoleus sp. FACHB-832]MBD2063123.1 glycosyltransferase family 4 protein [Trichocoleus sp. FACHB-6]